MQTETEPIGLSKTRVARQFARGKRTYEKAAIVQRETARRLTGMVRETASSYPLERVLELGCGTGLLTLLLVRQLPIRRLVLNDLMPELGGLTRQCRVLRPALRIEPRSGDMECLELPGDQDLVASNAVLQWATDPLAMLHKMLAAVAPGGFLAFATFGPENLREIRELTGRSLRYLSLDQIREELSPKSDVIDCCLQRRTIHFDSAFAVLQHLKRTGVNSLQDAPWSPRTVKTFCQSYEVRYREGETVPLTYEPLAVVARRR